MYKVSILYFFELHIQYYFISIYNFLCLFKIIWISHDFFKLVLCDYRIYIHFICKKYEILLNDHSSITYGFWIVFHVFISRGHNHVYLNYEQKSRFIYSKIISYIAGLVLISLKLFPMLHSAVSLFLYTFLAARCCHPSQ